MSETPSTAAAISRLIEDWVTSLPEVYFKLREALEDPANSFEDFGEIIRLDPALTARLLKIVNSPFYGFTTQIESVTRAMGIIGTDPLADLVLATSISSQFRGISRELIDMKTFWRHSIACGLVAQTLAGFIPKVNSERFFLAGLLHDIGKLVMARKMPHEMTRIYQIFRLGEEPLFQIELAKLGYSHSEVGQAILDVWKLPKQLKVPVAFHHFPRATQVFQLETAVVSLANILAHPWDADSGDNESPAFPDPWLMETTGLRPEHLVTARREAEDKIDRIQALFPA